MSINFSLDEMLAMAERIEQNGAEFYRRAAAQVSGGMTETLNWLAAEEDKHEKIFADMRQELKGKDQAPLVWDPDSEYEMYVQSLADGKVFDLAQDPAAIISGFETVKDILQFALDREKDSIVFYMVVNKVAPRQAGKKKIEGILDEEISHVALITNKLTAL